MSAWNAVTWDVARAGGITAYALLALSVVLGLALSLRWQRPRWPRLITNELHGFVTLLSLVFIAVHVLAVWIDPFTRFGWREVFIPLASHYRPLWMSLGIVALYLCLAIWISTYLRPHIGYAWWRRLHTLTLVVYALSTIHGLGTGSDTRTTWALALYAGSVALVGTLLSARLLTPLGRRGARHPRLAALSAAAVIAGIAWTVTGPMQAGWNATANNGQGNGARGVAAQQGASAGTQQSASATAPQSFSAALQGTYTQSDPDAAGAVSLDLLTNLRDGTQRSLDIVVQGVPAADGSLSVTATHVTLSTSSGAVLYQGQLTTLRGGRQWRMAAVVTGAGQPTARLRLAIALRISNDGRIDGTIQGTPISANQ